MYKRQDLDPLYPGLELVAPGRWKRLVYAFHCDGTTVPGWPYVGPDSALIGNSAAIGNIDGVGGLDVAVGNGLADWVAARHLLLIGADGSDLGGSPIDVGGFVQTSATLADLEGDGTIEILLPVGGTGMLECWEIPGTRSGASSLVWPTQQHDNRRTGFYPVFPESHAVPEIELYGGEEGSDPPVILRPGPRMDPASVTFLLRSAVSGPMTFQVFDVGGRERYRMDGERSVRAGVQLIRVPDTGGWPRGVYLARARVRTAGGAVVGTTKLAITR